MPRKLIGYLLDGVDRPNYLSSEVPVFESDQPGKGSLQVIDYSLRIVTGFEEVDLGYVKSIPADAIPHYEWTDLRKEYVCLAKYNEMYFAEPGSAFLPKLSRWMAQWQLTYLNQFSLYVLLNIRSEAITAAARLIETNELGLENLSIGNFSIPKPIHISKSKLSLKEILLCYTEITLGEKTSLSFESLFIIHQLDQEGVSLLEGNMLMIGNYYSEVNEFMNALILLNERLESNQEDDSVRLFQRTFLVLFGHLHPEDLAAGQLTERFELNRARDPGRARSLQFDTATVFRLIRSLRIKRAASVVRNSYRACADIDKMMPTI